MSLNLQLLLIVQLVALAGSTTATDPIFKLRSSHGSVVKGKTVNITLRCGMEGSGPVDEVVMIRISKKDENNEFQPLLTFTSLPIPLKTDRKLRVRIRAQLKPKSNLSFLEVRWTVADNYTVGEFRCDANGTKQGEDRFHVTSQTREIKEGQISKAVSLGKIKTVEGNVGTIHGSLSWPAGSYCISRFHENQCPSGFSNEEGYLAMNFEEDHGQTEIANSLYRSSFLYQGNGWFRNYFCCSMSVSPYIEIRPPRSAPFSLYRKGGACQMVKGMHVEEEPVEVDTGDTGNEKNRVVGPTMAIPDVKIDKAGTPTTLYLCHYSKDNNMVHGPNIGNPI